MASHFRIAVGLLMAGVFLWRGMAALETPGLGWRELYVLGGFVIAGLLIRSGWRGLRDGRADAPKT